MTSAIEQNRISEHAAKAAQALARGRIFEAERLAFKALSVARQRHDYDAFAAVIPTLMDARLQRLREALDVGRITLIDEPISEDVKVSKGCYLVRPPQVGADARRLRVAAFEQEAPIALLCCEPLTIVKLLPIVAICPGLTLRTKARPPKNLDKRGAPDLPWFIAAIEALGDFGIESLDPKMPALRRLDALLECLDALPEHEGLHRALQQACVDAKTADEQAKAAKPARKPKPVPAAVAQASEQQEDDEPIDE